MPPTWHATMIAADEVPQAPLLRRRFTLDDGHGAVSAAYLHVSAKGLVEPYLDGAAVSDEVLSPGWSSYEWRLRYRTHDVTALLTGADHRSDDGERADGGEHVLGLALGSGWSHGRLAWSGKSALYGPEIAGFAQLEITFADGHTQLVVTDTTWSAHASAVLADEIYDGQSIDARLLDPAWSTTQSSEEGWGGVHAIDFDTSILTEHIGPPVRRQEVVAAKEVWTSPSGKTLVDFGQNLVGWIRFSVSGAAGQTITVKHAEVLEHGELGTRPLRSAKATDTFVLSGGEDSFEPTFTFHGFRYAEVEGWPGQLRPQDREAVGVQSQRTRTGTFECR